MIIIIVIICVVMETSRNDDKSSVLIINHKEIRLKKAGFTQVRLIFAEYSASNCWLANEDNSICGIVSDAYRFHCASLG